MLETLIIPSPGERIVPLSQSGKLVIDISIKACFQSHDDVVPLQRWSR